MLKQYSFDVSVLVLMQNKPRGVSREDHSFHIDCQMSVVSESLEFSINTLARYIERRLEDVPGIALRQGKPEITCAIAPRAMLFSSRLQPVDGYVERNEQFEARIAYLHKVVNPTTGSCV